MIVVGNWKMNLDLTEGCSLAGQIAHSHPHDRLTKVVVCPSFVSLQSVGTVLAGTEIALGAQEIFWEDSGAFTGEIAGRMVKAAGCEYVLVGHSERRGRFGKPPCETGLLNYFAESDEIVSKKFWAALSAGLTPILCFGETKAERDGGKTDEVIESQLKPVFDDHRIGTAPFLLAYEPVWAIGTGNVCEDGEANRVCAHVRTLVTGRSWATDSQFELLYGGSVNASNASGLFCQPAIFGALVGGASLKADEFVQIISAAEAQYV